MLKINDPYIYILSSKFYKISFLCGTYALTLLNIKNGTIMTAIIPLTTKSIRCYNQLSLIETNGSKAFAKGKIFDLTY